MNDQNSFSVDYLKDAEHVMSNMPSAIWTTRIKLKHSRWFPPLAIAGYSKRPYERGVLSATYFLH